MKRFILFGVLILCVETGPAQKPEATIFAPLVDHHQHLLSLSLAPALSSDHPVTADMLIAQLDAAGIQRALVLSLGYTQGSPRIRGADEYAKVRAENDWTAKEVRKYPGRLRAFCSVNPLRKYALTEIARCAKESDLHYGLKLHLANSRVSLRKPEDVEQVRRVFGAANAHSMAIVVHVWTGPGYGAADAQIFLDEILPAAPDVPIQIAHLGGAGWPGPGLPTGASCIRGCRGSKGPAHAPSVLRRGDERHNAEFERRGPLHRGPSTADRPGAHPVRVRHGGRP